MEKTTQWSALPLKKIKKILKTDEILGLDFDDVQKRREHYGQNEFSKEQHSPIFSFFLLLLKQFKSPLVFVLIIAGVVALILGERLDAIVIFAALFINVSLGVFQEGRASRAFERLSKSQQKYATCLRAGIKRRILAAELVPGDIIFLDSGIVVPADARIISAGNLLVNESALTGEWLDIAKGREEEIRGPITEQKNMAWMGTLVSAGNAKAIVVETGDRTQVGKIAKSLAQEEERETPLQRNIKKLAYFISFIIAFIVVAIAGLGIIRGESFEQMFLIAVAVAVAAIPAGLPVAVTVVLALGMEAVLKWRGLVRSLLAAETLGSTTIILTDKTGTLTQAKMAVSDIASISTLEKYSVKRSSAAPLIFENTDERYTLKHAIYASDAFVEWSSDDEQSSDFVEKKNKKTKEKIIDPSGRVSFSVRGRPVERSIVLAGLENGLNQEALFGEHPRLDFLPFDSKRRLALSLHAWGSENRIIVTGAPEDIVSSAQFVYENGEVKSMTDKMRKEISAFQEAQSAKGVRMVGVGFQDTRHGMILEEVHHDSSPEFKHLVFLGLILLHDPVRPEAIEAITEAKRAGVEVIMLTGDYPATARAVAQDVGIALPGGRALSGSDIEKMDDTELLKELRAINVFARVLPHQKLRAARILKGNGEVVAMTGDGINDAPALRSADIGVALGSGTDVAKEASDLVLLDDNFNIIVHAIEEGRRIIDNLKKLLAYLLSTGFSEVLVVGAAVAVGAPLPILPAQILWINIIEEGFMNFAFAFEPKEKDIMRRNPRRITSSILTPALKRLIMMIAFITSLFLIALFFILRFFDMPIEEIRTIMFVALAVDSLFFSFSLKNFHTPLWKINPFSNKYLLFAFITASLTLLASLTIPPLVTLLSLTPLSPTILLFLLGLGIFNLALIEVTKHFVFNERPE